MRVRRLAVRHLVIDRPDPQQADAAEAVGAVAAAVLAGLHESGRDEPDPRARP